MPQTSSSSRVLKQRPLCEFEVWDREKKCMVKCGEPGEVRYELELEDDDVDSHVFCKEHAIDVLMRFPDAVRRYE